MPKIRHLRVPFKNVAESCLCVQPELVCICSLHIISSCFPVDLILLVENCVACLHWQDCCDVGPAALTMSLLLKDFQNFPFNIEVLQLFCTIFLTKRRS